MDILWMFLLGAGLMTAILIAIDYAKYNAYQDGRRAGYARAIADSRNSITQ